MATYISPNAPNFFLSIKVGDKKLNLQWEHCQLDVTNEATIAALDAEIEASARIARMVSKVDKAVAEQLAREHMSKIGPAGIRGGINSESLNHLRNGAVESESLKLQQLGSTAEDALNVAKAVTGRK